MFGLLKHLNLHKVIHVVLTNTKTEMDGTHKNNIRQNTRANTINIKKLSKITNTKTGMDSANKNNQERTKIVEKINI